MTGKSKDNNHSYLFVGEVQDMVQVERDLKEKYSFLREIKRKEIYLYNEEVFNFYVDFIKEHPLFISEVFLEKKEKKEQIKIIKKDTPTLDNRGITPKDVMQQAQKIKNDEFYTQYEDVEKEVEMYEKKI